MSAGACVCVCLSLSMYNYIGIVGSDLAAAHAAGTWPVHWGPGKYYVL